MGSLRRARRAVQDRLVPAKIGRGSVIELISKPDCHLCEAAKRHLHRLQRQWGFELREVNIAGDEELLAEFGTRIPLVRVNGQLACKYEIDEARLRQKLERAARSAGEE